jgi:hypothetical protein
VDPSWLVDSSGSSESVLSDRRGYYSKRRGEDACDNGILGDIARCEGDDQCIELLTLEGGPPRMPTDTIFAEGDIVVN